MAADVIAVVLDACTLIILEGCGALDFVLSLPDHQFFIGPLVTRECQPGCATAIERYIQEGRLLPVADELITTTRFMELLQRYRLGDGETECLVVCETAGYSIATDDRAARRAATELYGASRLTGTLGLLRAAVIGRAISAAEALAFYRHARHAGAFLPEVDDDFFRT